MIASADEHQIARELAQHHQTVVGIQRKAQRWRLQDCEEPTLIKMRHALIEEMLPLRERLSQADDFFLQCIQAGEPLATDKSLQQINRLSAEWHALNGHLQDVDNAIVERHIQTRMSKLLGSPRNFAIWDGFVLVIIVASIVITLFELVFLNRPFYVGATNMLIMIDTVICLLLLADFFARLWVVEDRRWYWRKYWIDFVASLPLAGILRLGRLARIARFARLLRIFRAFRSLSETFRGLDKLSQTFEVTLLRRSLIFAVVLLFGGAFAIGSFEQIEHLPGESDLQKGIWWSFTTVATGGFADIHDPTTIGGRVLTGGLVILGFVVTGVFTASLTSVLLGDESRSAERNFNLIEDKLEGVVGQLDLLSNQTNEGLLALETVAQALSNGDSAEKIAASLCGAMTDSFEAMQASVHLLEGETIQRIANTGFEAIAPAEMLQLSEGLLGEVAAHLRTQDLRTLDIEPVDRPMVQVKGIALACPLVAQTKLLGFLHVVMPENLGRYYLYNRAPMTLAHHAAIALHPFSTV